MDRAPWAGRDDAQLRDLEVVPARWVDYRGGRFEEVDVAAVIARQPDAVLIDELAHTNVDGTGKRWKDVAELLAAGLSVMTTLNVPTWCRCATMRRR